MRSAFKNPVVVASVGRQLSATLRESLADLNWRMIHGFEPVAALKAIRMAGARVTVVEITAGASAGLELIRLLSGPACESSVVAVSGSHDESIERDARAMGAACYVPFTADVTAIVEAVSGILEQSDSASQRRAKVRPIRPSTQISSFPPPATITGDGFEPNSSPVRRNGKSEREIPRSR